MTKAIIATTEIDMKNNFEIIYMIIRFLITIDTLYKNIKLIVNSKGYDMIIYSQKFLLGTYQIIVK